MSLLVTIFSRYPHVTLTDDVCSLGAEGGEVLQQRVEAGGEVEVVHHHHLRPRPRPQPAQPRLQLRSTALAAAQREPLTPAGENI